MRAKVKPPKCDFRARKVCGWGKVAIWCVFVPRWFFSTEEDVIGRYNCQGRNVVYESAKEENKEMRFKKKRII